MKILHVLDHSLPISDGYAFRSDAILRGQRELGWETVQVTGPKHQPFDALVESAAGLEYCRTASSPGWLQSLPAGDQLAVITDLRRRLRGVVSRERPDIVHAHSPCLNALAAMSLGVPLVYELRSSWEDAAVSSGTTTEGSLRYRASRWLETHALRRAVAVTTICEGLRRDVIARGVKADRVTVVPNAVDPQALRATRSAAGAAEAARARHGLGDEYVLGFIGSFFAWEGLPLLLEALPRVIARRPDTRVLLVGGGAQDALLRGLTEQLGLTKHVVFTGQVPHRDVADLYEAIDLLVYPRLPMRLTDMVTPLKPLEAMALGKLFVASDVGGHKELVRDRETGVLFEAGRADALADCIISVMEDPILQRHMREQGPSFIERERTWARVVPRYREVYERVLGRLPDAGRDRARPGEGAP
jgi:PEP-CTERM/exosortase A-associated glycosyltransferase